MRYARKFAQAQKREEQEIFKCYYQAIRVAKMDGHLENLRLVRENLIEGENDLTVNVWENFLNVCYELGVDINPLCKTVKIHPTDSGKGNGYRIPSKECNLLEHMKKRQIRSYWRDDFRQKFETGYSSEIIQKLSKPKLRIVKGRIG